MYSSDDCCMVIVEYNSLIFAVVGNAVVHDNVIGTTMKRVNY